MSRLSRVAIAVALVLPIGLAAAAAAKIDRPAVERAFQAWIKNDLWPEAQAAGVAGATYEAAFKGVTLDWDLPELVPPGTAAPPNVEHQAEFRSPAAYFHEGRIATLARSGRARHGKWEKSLAAVEKRYGVPAWDSGFGLGTRVRLRRGAAARISRSACWRPAPSWAGERSFSAAS